MFIIMVGNVVDGLNFIGPFDDGETANEYGQDRLRHCEYWVVSLDCPDQKWIKEYSEE